MLGFGLFVGHLVGDYIFQRDWEAKRKTVFPPTKPRPELAEDATPEQVKEWLDGTAAWDCQQVMAKEAGRACTWHCLLYTLAVAMFTWPWMAWWTFPLIFAAHWPVDRYRLARRWMERVGQAEFASGPFAPWSIIAVDNTFHLVVLYVAAVFGGTC